MSKGFQLFERKLVSWRESWRFRKNIRGKINNSSTFSRFLVVVLIVAISFIIWLARGQKAEVLDVLVTSLIFSLVCIFPLYWFIIYSPKKIRLYETKALIENEEIFYKDVRTVIFDRIYLSQDPFLSMSILKSDGYEYVIGMPDSLDVEEVENILVDLGLTVQNNLDRAIKGSV